MDEQGNETPSSSIESTDDDLPALDWELYDQRKLLPPDLKQVLGLPVSVIRVANEIDVKIRTKHAENVEQYELLNRLLKEWQLAGCDPQDSTKWEVYIPLDATHWLAVVLGQDQRGSHNLVSLYTTRDRNVQNRVKKGYLRTK